MELGMKDDADGNWHFALGLVWIIHIDNSIMTAEIIEASIPLMKFVHFSISVLLKLSCLLSKKSEHAQSTDMEKCTNFIIEIEALIVLAVKYSCWFVWSNRGPINAECQFQSASSVMPNSIAQLRVTQARMRRNSYAYFLRSHTTQLVLLYLDRPRTSFDHPATYCVSAADSDTIQDRLKPGSSARKILIGRQTIVRNGSELSALSSKKEGPPPYPFVWGLIK
jgi:hypothetical protein